MIFIILHIIAALFFWPALFLTIPLHIIASWQKKKITSEHKDLQEIKELLARKEGNNNKMEQEASPVQHSNNIDTQKAGDTMLVIGGIIFFGALFVVIVGMM
jgi:hypothetical protein